MGVEAGVKVEERWVGMGIEADVRVGEVTDHQVRPPAMHRQVSRQTTKTVVRRQATPYPRRVLVALFISRLACIWTRAPDPLCSRRDAGVDFVLSYSAATLGAGRELESRVISCGMI